MKSYEGQMLNEFLYHGRVPQFEYDYDLNYEVAHIIEVETDDYFDDYEEVSEL